MRSCQSGTIDRAWQTSAGDVCCDRVEMVSTRSVPVRRIVAGLRHGPYAVPRTDESLRFAQVGRSTYFEACALDDSLDGIETVFADFRAGADPTPVREALERFAPHVVLVFRPEILPAGFSPDSRPQPSASSPSRFRARRRTIPISAGVSPI
jgi:hypothetical protein